MYGPTIGTKEKRKLISNNIKNIEENTPDLKQDFLQFSDIPFMEKMISQLKKSGSKAM